MSHVVGRGVAVTALSLGTAALGGLFTHVDEDEAERVVRRALHHGITYIDTAPQYGHGTSERRVGAALATAARSSFVLSTKVGRLVTADPDGDTGLFADAPPSRVLFEVGIADWKIWRSGSDLFHVVDCDDFDAAMAQLDASELNERWQRHINTIVDHFVTGPSGMALARVWTLTEQLADGPADG